MKKCASCKFTKENNCFGKDTKRTDGLKPWCKECRKIKEGKTEADRQRKKNWYLANKQKTIERAKEHSITHKEDVRGYKEKYYANNKDKVKQKASFDYHNNKHNPEFIAKRNKIHYQWKQRNKHTVAWRSLLSTSLKKLRQKKTSSTVTMLGYTENDLKIHIENLWTFGMSWDNYGEWHIDHIKPINTFSKSENVKVVNALSNLRPLWATNRIINGIFYEGNLNRDKKC